MAKKIVLVLALVIAGVLAFASTRPDEVQIAREITLKAPPETIFPFINNAQKSNDWMPWKDMDPELKMTFSGPAEGVGSQASWESPGRMGVGKSEIVESVPNKSVKMQLTYLKPMEMKQSALMELEPTAEGTKVRWSVVVPQNLMSKVVCLFMNMDKMVGGNFEQGFQKLKVLVDGQTT